MPFRWSEGAARYRDVGTGKFVPAAQVRGAVDAVIQATSDRLQQITSGLQTGALTIEDWRGLMAQEIKNLHLATASAAQGGWAQMSQADFGWVGGVQIKPQYAFLGNFADEIASGKQPLDGTLLFRSSLYAQAGRGTFNEMERRQAKLKRTERERRVLGPADHCPSCLSEASRGWQPLGTLRRIGDSECRANCRCHFEFKQAA